MERGRDACWDFLFSQILLIEVVILLLCSLVGVCFCKNRTRLRGLLRFASPSAPQNEVRLPPERPPPPPPTVPYPPYAMQPNRNEVVDNTASFRSNVPSLRVMDPSMYPELPPLANLNIQLSFHQQQLAGETEDSRSPAGDLRASPAGELRPSPDGELRADSNTVMCRVNLGGQQDD